MSSIEPAPERVLIRRADERDIAAVLACLAATFEPYRSLYTPDPFRDTVMTKESAEPRFREMTVLVALDEHSSVVGTIAYQVAASSEGHLRGMAVLPAFQGYGVAERLLAAAETALAADGCSRVTLDTTEPLQRAIRFYRRHGYHPSGRVQDFYGMPLFEYQKLLNPI